MKNRVITTLMARAKSAKADSARRQNVDRRAGKFGAQIPKEKRQDQKKSRDQFPEGTLWGDTMPPER